MYHQTYQYPLGMPKLQLEISLLEGMLEALSNQDKDRFVETIGDAHITSAGAAILVFRTIWSLGWVETTKRSEALDGDWADMLRRDHSSIDDLSEEDAHEVLSWMVRGEKWCGGHVGFAAQDGSLDRILSRLLKLKRARAHTVDDWMGILVTPMALRDDLVRSALLWQQMFGVAPSITSAISEFDAARLVGMSFEDYSKYMADKTSVSKGSDFIFNGVRYQVKANRPSGKKGSQVTIVGKANNYDWDQLIWIHYDTSFIPNEAWLWHVDSYTKAFDHMERLSPSDYRKGIKLDISVLLK